jgi:hypothetical protein
MIGMDVGVDRLYEFAIQLLQHAEILVNLFQDWINDHGFSTSAARQNVSVGTRRAVKQLSEDHRVPPSR